MPDIPLLYDDKGNAIFPEQTEQQYWCIQSYNSLPESAKQAIRLWLEEVCQPAKILERRCTVEGIRWRFEQDCFYVTKEQMIGAFLDKDYQVRLIKQHYCSYGEWHIFVRPKIPQKFYSLSSFSWEIVDYCKQASRELWPGKEPWQKKGLKMTQPFNVWLTEQKNRRDPVGDIAETLKKEQCCRDQLKFGDFERMRNHLYYYSHDSMLGSPSDAVTALYEAFDEWQSGEDRIPTGHVYFIQEEHDGPIKIGYAKDPTSRLATLQTAHHKQLNLIGYFIGRFCDEAFLKKKFAHLQIRGEWFRPEEELLHYIQFGQGKNEALIERKFADLDRDLAEKKILLTLEGYPDAVKQNRIIATLQKAGYVIHKSQTIFSEKYYEKLEITIDSGADVSRTPTVSKTS